MSVTIVTNIMKHYMYFEHFIVTFYFLKLWPDSDDLDSKSNVSTSFIFDF